MTGPAMEWDGGVRLSGSILWFDAARRDVLSFVSSARLPGVTRLRQAICTDRTRTLIRAVHGDFQALVAPRGRPVNLGRLQVGLFPSGALPGASQARVETPDGTLLYAPDVFDDPLPWAEAPEPVRADVLIVDATHGGDGETLPSRAEALRRVVEESRAALEAGRTPVLLCGPVGPAQDVCRALGEAGVPVRVARPVNRWNAAWRAAGTDPGAAREFRGGGQGGAAIVWPADLRGSPQLRSVHRPWFVRVDGAAGRPDALARARADAGVPFPVHPDRAALDRLADRVGARIVYAVGRGASEFAAALAARGIDGRVLRGGEQLAMFE